MKLVSMIDFVQWIKFEPPKTDEDHSNHFGYKFGMVCKYANFLNQPLNLGMFVPAIEVDGKWEVLEEPKNFEATMKGNYFTSSKSELFLLQQYQKAKENVLFEGFELNIFKSANVLRNENISFYEQFSNFKDRFDSICLKTIQDLIKYKPTLTKKGLEVSGLNR